MAEKFNGFSHDEILKITGAKQGNRLNIDAGKFRILLKILPSLFVCVCVC